MAWRSLHKNRLQTGINLLGLSIGTVCCLCILLYVFAQLGYDEHHQDAELIYRLRTDSRSTLNNSRDVHFATAGPPYAYALKNDFPEITEATRIVYLGADSGELLRVADEREGFFEPHGYLADSTIFNVLTFKFLEGTAKNALNDPNTIVLSSSLANKLYGDQSALNRTIIRGNGESELGLKVTGVFDDSYGKSHLAPNYIITMNTPGLGEFVRNTNDFATQNFIYTYLKLAPNTSAGNLEGKFPDFLERHASDDLAANGREKELFLQPIQDIHLYSEGIDMQIGTTSSMTYLKYLMLLALFIQSVACINFINLSTARANKRAKEIGIRKTIGADRKNLVMQFMGESLLLSLVACMISIPITIIILPVINEITQSQLTVLNLFDWPIFISLFGIGILTGLIAGFYPALVLSTVKPVSILKGSLNTVSGNVSLRKVLVVFQFVISISLIVSVIVTTQQVRFSQQKELGFDGNNLLALRLGSDEAKNNQNGLRNSLKEIKGVVSTAASNTYPSQPREADMGLHLPSQSSSNITTVVYNGISPEYFETVGTQLLKGRRLSETDTTQIIVNLATIEAFGIDLEEAVGSKLIYASDVQPQELEIVGVTENYHFASLKEAIRPTLHYLESRTDWLVVKAQTHDYQDLLLEIETKWKALNQSTPFVYKFIDNEAEKLFEEEKRVAKISSIFTGLAILLSSMGLFGLISFIAEQRKKEIGIRKILGAGVGMLLRLLVADFIILIIVALIIATPLSYYFMNSWLMDFQYRISIHGWVFLAGGGIALAITLITVSLEAFKSAMANPIKSLNAE